MLECDAVLLSSLLPVEPISGAVVRYHLGPSNSTKIVIYLTPRKDPLQLAHRDTSRTQ